MDREEREGVCHSVTTAFETQIKKLLRRKAAMSPPDSSSGQQNRRWSLNTRRKREREGNGGGEAREERERGNAAGGLTRGQEGQRDESTATASGDIAACETTHGFGESNTPSPFWPSPSRPSPSRVVRHEVETLSPPRRGRDAASGPRVGTGETVAEDVVVVETTRGWARNMPSRLDSDELAEACAIDLTGSQAEDEVEIVSSNVARVVPPALVARKRRRAGAARSAGTTTEELVLRMLEQQQAAAAAAPPPEPSTNPTCGICFDAMGKNTDRQMAAGNCGHVYCKPCLLQAVKNRKKCPMCSMKMSLKQIRNIFFEM